MDDVLWWGEEVCKIGGRHQIERGRIRPVRGRQAPNEGFSQAHNDSLFVCDLHFHHLPLPFFANFFLPYPCPSSTWNGPCVLKLVLSWAPNFAKKFRTLKTFVGKLIFLTGKKTKSLLGFEELKKFKNLFSSFKSISWRTFAQNDLD